MKLLIKSGRLINPATDKDMTCDILIEDNLISKIESYIDQEADQVIDAYGCFVMPGFIDLHVHLREPGFEHKETIETGAKAAASGGYTTICAMPNTKPVTDNKDIVEWLVEKAKKEAIINVLFVGAVTKNQAGEELADIEGMIKAGIPAISEDGKSVMDSNLYKKAMIIAKENNIIVMAHCEDIKLVDGGVINKGTTSDKLKVPGISNDVEDVITARDIILSKETKVPLHLCHCSTKDSVRMVKEAKADKLIVTAEVCPHHFILSDEDIIEDDANYKMNPPLRTKEDVEALKEGLRLDIMDVISTDHAPHHKDEKAQGFLKAPFGIIGSETAAALTYTELVDKGYLTPMQMAAKMSYNPAKVISLDKGDISVGKIADIAIFNPNITYTIKEEDIVSKGKNTPFIGKEVKGKVVFTIVDGKIVYKYQ